MRIKNLLFTLSAILLAVLPFERIPSVTVSGVTIKMSSIVLLVALIIGAVAWFRDRKIPQLDLPDRILLIWYIWAWLITPFAVSRSVAVHTMLLWTVVLTGYFMVSRYVRASKEQAMASRILITVGLVTATFGLLQFILNTYFNVPGQDVGLTPNYVKAVFGFARIQSVGIEPLYYAAFLHMPVFLAMVTVLFNRAKRQLVSILTLAFLILVEVLTLSRGAYLGIIGGSIVVVLALIWLRQLPWKSLGVVAVAAVLAIACAEGFIALSGLVGTSANGAASVTTFSEHAIGGTATRGTSVDPRIAAMKDAYAMAKKHLVVGVGPGNYGVVTTLQKTAQNQKPIVNNFFLEVLAEQGVIGLILCLAFFATIFIRLLMAMFHASKVNPFQVAMLGALIALGVQMNFFSTLYVVTVWVGAGLASGAAYDGYRS